MDAIWIAAALIVAVVGGWPVTAGILKFARSETVRAVDAAESGDTAAPAGATELDMGPVQGPGRGPVRATELDMGPGTGPDHVSRTGPGPGPAPARAPRTGPGQVSGPGPDHTSETEPGTAADARVQASEATAPDAPAETAGPVEPGAAEIPAAPPKGEVLRGGLLIGLLERAGVAVAIFSGQPIAIAYVVAIKALGRYPELKNTPAASERFIIGTLASMLFSASVAVLAKTLLHIG